MAISFERWVGSKIKYTSFFFNKFSYFSSVVDVAVVQDKNASWSGIRVCKQYLMTVSKETTSGYRPKEGKMHNVFPKKVNKGCQ